ncbi:flagellin [Rhizobium leguminosarum]|uniref:flagellin n=1 Tax=Rhizobium leguminosarum TaxID=384 RepID=UPI00143FB551|nr:flagellin [Rhizobium leguminosarum]
MAKLDSLQKRLDLAEEASKGLIDSTTPGFGKLVDADMETVSTRMKALQTQQQLAIQALNIANQAPQAMLQLFR